VILLWKKKKIIAVVGATEPKGGGLVRSILKMIVKRNLLKGNNPDV